MVVPADKLFVLAVGIPNNDLILLRYRNGVEPEIKVLLQYPILVCWLSDGIIQLLYLVCQYLNIFSAFVTRHLQYFAFAPVIVVRKVMNFAEQ